MEWWNIYYSGNEDFINGYHVKFENQVFDKLVRPHHLLKIDATKLIEIEPVGNDRTLRERRLQRQDMPIANIVERVNEPWNQRNYQPPTLDDIFNEEN